MANRKATNPKDKNTTKTAVTFSLSHDTIEIMDKFFDEYCIDKSKFIEKIIAQNIELIS